MTYDILSPRIWQSRRSSSAAFALFSRESEQRYREQFEGVTRIVMKSIEGMLDSKYRRGCTAT